MLFDDKVQQIKQAWTAYQMNELSHDNFEEILKKLWLQASKPESFPLETINEDIGRDKRELAKFREYAVGIPNYSSVRLKRTRGSKGDTFNEADFETCGINHDHLFDELKTSLSEKLEQLGISYSDEVLLFKLIWKYLDIHIHSLENRLEASAPQNYKPAVPDYVGQAESKTANSDLLFSKIYQKFIEHKVGAGLSANMQKDYVRYLSDWSALADDKPIEEYKRKDIKVFLQSMMSVPKRNKAIYKNIQVSQLLEMEIPADDLLSPKSVSGYKKWLQGVFAYARNELELIEVSPTDNLGLKLKASTSYASYDSDEIACFISDAKTRVSSDWKKWVVLVALYSGARLGEIVQLAKKDIKAAPDSDRYYFHITNEGEHQNVKTENSIRQIPIHNKLIEEGFMQFVASAKEMLFPKVDSKKVTSWFYRYRVSLGIEGIDDFGQRKVFHSFRHSFITEAKNNGVDIHKLQQVVGHEKTSFGITDRYTHAAPLKALFEVVDSIQY